MGKLFGALLCLALVACGSSAATSSSKPPKVALFYGDSLVYESVHAIQMGAGWKVVNRSVAGSAACDWTGELPTDLATLHPTVVVVSTAGSTTNGPSDYPTCEHARWGSAQYRADYTNALRAFASQVGVADAQLVFVEDPPFLDPDRAAARVTVNEIESKLASEYPKTTLDVKASKALSTKTGGYEGYAKCLKGETAAMGCRNGLIAIRTVTGVNIGLHFCPNGLNVEHLCSVYSSGEVRFGNALVAAAKHPHPVSP